MRDVDPTPFEFGVRDDIVELSSEERFQQEQMNSVHLHLEILGFISRSVVSIAAAASHSVPRPPISPKLFKDLHKIAVANVWKNAGEWRTKPRYVADHIAPKAHQIESLMAEMCDYVSTIDDPWDAAAMILWRANWIHPFDDGNGRVARAVAWLAITPSPDLFVGGFIRAISCDETANILEECDKLWLAGDQRLETTDIDPMINFVVEKWGECKNQQLLNPYKLR
jgi:fido (protein-threonine AMPylation protein)